MRGRDIEGQHLDELRETGGLAFGQLEHKSREGGGVDDRMLERALQATADEPGVECIMAVFDEHRALRETQEPPARIAKLRCSDEHRPIDVMAPVGIWVDWSLAVDERVEEGERAFEPEALSADLQDEEG
jgi:hypothetical protein